MPSTTYEFHVHPARDRARNVFTLRVLGFTLCLTKVDRVANAIADLNEQVKNLSAKVRGYKMVEHFGKES